jgi:hypothetical protein
MENSIITERGLNNDSIYETIFKIENKYVRVEPDVTSGGLTAEDGRNFFHYLKNFNLNHDPGLLILPPNNHYYFDEKELSSVKTLINLKNMNLIKELDDFLYTLIRLLPSDANFLGYFTYNKISFTGDNLFSGLSARLNNFLDFRTDHNLNDKELTGKLYKHGFRLIDMTQQNGLTFFYSKSFHRSSKHVA